MIEELGFSAKCLVNKYQDKAAMFVAWMLPRRVVLWAYVRVMAHATSGPYGTENVDSITYSTAYRRWEEGPHEFTDDPFVDMECWDDNIEESFLAFDKKS